MSIQADPEPADALAPEALQEPIPEPGFCVVGARHRDFAATPTMV